MCVATLAVIRFCPRCPCSINNNRSAIVSQLCWLKLYDVTGHSIVEHVGAENSEIRMCGIRVRQQMKRLIRQVLNNEAVATDIAIID